MVPSRNPVRAEHAFPPTKAVDSLRAYSLPVQSPRRPQGVPPSAVPPSAGAAFGGGPRFARGTGLNSASGLTLQATIPFEALHLSLTEDDRFVFSECIFWYRS